MKHVPTINNEIISFLCDIQDRASQEAFDVSMEIKKNKHELGALPGKHIISNILNYAKAMHVVNNTSGEKFILLQN